MAGTRLNRLTWVVTATLTLAVWPCSDAHAALQEITYSSGAFEPFDLVSPATAYTGVAYNNRVGNTNEYLATRADGGVDNVYYDGVWNVDPYALGGVTYTDVTYNALATNQNLYLATRADGGLEELFWNGSTFTQGDLVNTGVTYTGVANKSRGSNVNTYMATRADGGVDEVYYNGTWNVDSYALDGVVYTDITYNSLAGNQNLYFATRADGGVEEIFWNGSSFVRGDLVSSSVLYNGVAHNSQAAATDYEYLATRADGGVDNIFFVSSAWNVVDYDVDDILFGDLAYNSRATNPDSYFATVVPEPASVALLGLAGVLFLSGRRR